MKFIPAIDLKDNKCVRLKKGKEENLTVFNNEPVIQAKFFEKNGCERIHIIDLDGAFGRMDVNKQTNRIKKIEMKVLLVKNNEVNKMFILELLLKESYHVFLKIIFSFRNVEPIYV